MIMIIDIAMYAAAVIGFGLWWRERSENRIDRALVHKADDRARLIGWLNQTKDAVGEAFSRDGRTINPFHCDIPRLVRDLKGERDCLRDSLESVEWEGWLGDDEVGCALCDAPTVYDPVSGARSGTHDSDCKVGRALGRPECRGDA